MHTGMKKKNAQAFVQTLERTTHSFAIFSSSAFGARLVIHH